MVETIFKGEGIILGGIKPLIERVCHKMMMNIGMISPIPVIKKCFFH
jgi:hypothetical protein